MEIKESSPEQSQDSTPSSDASAPVDVSKAVDISEFDDKPSKPSTPAPAEQGSKEPETGLNVEDITKRAEDRLKERTGDNEPPDLNIPGDKPEEANDNEPAEVETPEVLPVPEGWEEAPESMQQFAAHLPEAQRAKFKQFNDNIQALVTQTHADAEKYDQYYQSTQPAVNALATIRQDFPEYADKSDDFIVQEAYDLNNWKQNVQKNPYAASFALLMEQDIARQRQEGIPEGQINPRRAIEILRHMFTAKNSEQLVANYAAQADSMFQISHMQKQGREQRYNDQRNLQFQQTFQNFTMDQKFGPVYGSLMQVQGAQDMFRETLDYIQYKNPRLSDMQALQQTTIRVLKDLGYSNDQINGYLGNKPAQPKVEKKPKQTKTQNKKPNATGVRSAVDMSAFD